MTTTYNPATRHNHCRPRASCQVASSQAPYGRRLSNRTGAAVSEAPRRPSDCQFHHLGVLDWLLRRN